MLYVDFLLKGEVEYHKSTNSAAGVSVWEIFPRKVQHSPPVHSAHSSCFMPTAPGFANIYSYETAVFDVFSFDRFRETG